jgi:DNA-binding LytR/AlgR family response regulator
MKMKIAVCDDESTQTETISSIVEKWGTTSGHICEIKSFSSSEAFLFDYDEEKTYDILLLDVEMKGMSGVDLAKRIRRDNKRAEIVFITSHFEFFGEGYEVNALHYLIKPITEEKLLPVLSRAAEKLSVEPPSLVVICESGTVKLWESEIVYVESLLHYIIIHTLKGDYKTKESISAFSERVSNDFYRVHRSYLASLKHIVRISRNTICMENGTELPLARGKYDDINRAFIERN